MNKYTIVCIKVTTIIDFILILLTPNKTTFLFYLPVVTNIGPTSTCHFVEDFFHKLKEQFVNLLVSKKY